MVGAIHIFGLAIGVLGIYFMYVAVAEYVPDDHIASIVMFIIAFMLIGCGTFIYLT